MANPPECKMLSFDLVLLFINVRLDETTDIIVKRIYDKKEINTEMPKKEMKELLYLCTKNAHFTLITKLHSYGWCNNWLTSRSLFSKHLYEGARTKNDTFVIQ